MDKGASVDALKDVVIVLPGLMGSVLQHNGKDIWNLSGQTLLQFLRTDYSIVDALNLDGDDTDAPELDDGVRATALLDSSLVVPLLMKSDGYRLLRATFQESFSGVKAANLYSPRVENAEANYIEFPYDWRRHISSAAKRLHMFATDYLPKYREKYNLPEAKVIIVAHSLGSLVGRYFIEVLGGWEWCKVLFSLGGPHLGSLSPIDFANPGRTVSIKAYLGLADVARSFTSLSELLPTYRTVQVNGTFKRLDQVTPEQITQLNLDPKRVPLAFQYYNTVQAAQQSNEALRDYRKSFKFIPIVGIYQGTVQSVKLGDGPPLFSRISHSDIPVDMADGDGTVARISAIPTDALHDMLEFYLPGTHGTLQNQAIVQRQIINHVRKLQRPVERFRGGGPSTERGVIAGLGLDVAPLYLMGQPVTIAVDVHQTKTDLPLRVTGSIEPVNGKAPAEALTLAQVEDGRWSTALEGMVPGVYRVTVQANNPDIAPVSDLIEIAEE